jgi:hypothetical protein
MIASSQGKTWPPQTLLSKRQRVALSLDIPVAEHTDQSDAYSATAEAARQERPNRARTIRLLSLVVSDIAEAELVGGSGRPGSLVSARSQTRRRGAATAHAQGYARPDEGSRARPRRTGRPLWAAGHGARRRDPGEAGRPQPAVRDLEPPQLRRSNELCNRFVSPHPSHETPQGPGPWTCPAQTMWGRSTSRASRKPRLTSSSSPSKRRSSCSIETTWS